MNDIVNEINAVHRAVGTRGLPDGDAHTILLRRGYDADIEDVWEACTSPERISRWFLPVSGDFRLGGKYQLEGNAGGEILRCEPPRLLRVSWIYGGGMSEVEVRLTPGEGEETVFELEHIAAFPPEMWDQFGPGAAGVGWDGVLRGLGRHLVNPTFTPPKEWQHSDEARRFMTASAEAWGNAFAATGADPQIVASTTANTTNFYVPPAAE